MAILDDRKKGSEEKFRLEQAASIQAESASKPCSASRPLIRFRGREADEYAKSVMFADLQAPSDDYLIKG
jgi:hypothetical protein